MKNRIWLLLSVLFLATCKKESSPSSFNEEISKASNGNSNKILVCHKGKTISISANAWPAHQAHGDLLGDCSEVEIKICDQVWMKKNLDVATYRNGDPIPEVKDEATWASLTTGAYCYYNFDPANGPIYGKLYNRTAILDPRGLAPKGWHISSQDEWKILIQCADEIDPGYATRALREAGTDHWISNINGTNSTGFTALPGGTCQFNGTFYGINLRALFWCSGEYEIGSFKCTPYTEFYNYTIPPEPYTPSVGANLCDDNAGLSIRCVKDN